MTLDSPTLKHLEAAVRGGADVEYVQLITVGHSH